MTDTIKHDAQAIIDAAPKPFLISPKIGDHVCVPQGWSVGDLEYLLDAPRRAKGVRKLHDAASFIALVNIYKTLEAQTYCAADFHKGGCTFTTTFNPPAAAREPGWDDFRAHYAVPKSLEWDRWIGANKREFSQAEFALWIEDNARDIAEAPGYPTGTQMLEMALAFESTQDARLRSSVRLQSGGIELTYVDQGDSEMLQRMKLFDRFALGIPPFRGGTMYRVMARLRYRTKDGKVTFWYELIRPDIVVQDAVKDLVAMISEQTTIPVYYGEI